MYDASVDGSPKPRQIFLEGAACKARFPWLRDHPTLDSCIVMTQDHSSHTRLFALNLAERCRTQGVEFHFGADVDGFEFEFQQNAPSTATAVRFSVALADASSVSSSCSSSASFSNNTLTDSTSRLDSDRQSDGLQGHMKQVKVIPADAVVVCTGPASPDNACRWFESAAPKLPILPMRGCSLELEGCSGDVPDLCLHDLASGFDFQVTPFPRTLSNTPATTSLPWASSSPALVSSTSSFSPGHVSSPAVDTAEQAKTVRLIGFGEWAGDVCQGGTHNRPLGGWSGRAETDHSNALRSYLSRTIPGLKVL